ncbi:hypothetical protein [Streptomyces sp. V1I1]|uniref:hypothetical protein n=1 Tax=Streptomyces sp. V1I1 TaxID=3042272 RepID=UPI002781A2ED|nr:hypothetical protein [Streptomyces sp. V1I1]MDQ0941270.1 hypothetical protein [Streptomyces sp. V1I1]
MRLLVRLAALVTVLALTWVLAPGAVAGGPTSVLITSPESSETASLYYSDTDYTALLNLLGDGPTKGQTDRPPSLDMAVDARQINVTWMVHDVQPWRVDRVYPRDRAGAVWIHTAREMESQRGYWHQARQPAGLSGLFKKLGLMGKKSGGAGVAEYPPAWDDGQAQDQGQSQQEAEPATAPAAAPASDGTTTGWWWAIPGLAAGAALTLVLRPLASRLPRPPFGRGGTPEPGPRQQLLDG